MRGGHWWSAWRFSPAWRWKRFPACFTPMPASVAAGDRLAAGARHGRRLRAERVFRADAPAPIGAGRSSRADRLRRDPQLHGGPAAGCGVRGATSSPAPALRRSNWSRSSRRTASRAGGSSCRAASTNSISRSRHATPVSCWSCRSGGPAKRRSAKVRTARDLLAGFLLRHNADRDDGTRRGESQRRTLPVPPLSRGGMAVTHVAVGRVC